MGTDTVDTARNRALRALAALFGVVFATACILVWLANRDGPTGTEPAPIGPPDEAPTVLGDDGLTTAAPVEPGELAWVEVSGVRLPVLAGAGPDTLASGLASGFAQCEAGAALAAAHLVSRSLPQAGSAVFEPTINGQFTGEYRSDYLEAVERTYAVLRMDTGAAEGEPAGEHPGAFVGYRIDHATEATVTLRLLIENPDAGNGLRWASMLVVVEWIDVDWHIVAPADGTWEGTLSVLKSDADFERWAAMEPCEGAG